MGFCGDLCLLCCCRQSTLSEEDKFHYKNRLQKYSARLQYLGWNVIVTVALYLLDDSKLHIYAKYPLKNGHIYYWVAFHTLQLTAMILYFITSFSNPGRLNPSPYSSKYRQMVQQGKKFPFYSIPSPATSFESNSKGKDIISPSDFNDEENINDDNNSKQSSEQAPLMHNENDNDPPSVERVDVETLSNPPPEMVVRKNRANRIPDELPLYYCERCSLIKPVRCYHCYECDTCVLKFDHHCPMVGNCIGLKNHRYFLMFLYVQLATLAWTIYFAIDTLIISKQRNNRKAIGWIIRVPILAVLLLMGFINTSLLIYHTVMALTNRTTYQMLRPLVIMSYFRLGDADFGKLPKSTRLPWVNKKTKQFIHAERFKRKSETTKEFAGRGKEMSRSHMEHSRTNKSGAQSLGMSNINEDSQEIRWPFEDELSNSDYEDLKDKFNYGICDNIRQFCRGKPNLEWISTIHVEVKSNDYGSRAHTPHVSHVNVNPNTGLLGIDNLQRDLHNDPLEPSQSNTRTPVDASAVIKHI